MNLKYLITGTGRCGTVFMARLFTSLGIQCGHESFFNWKGIRGAEKKLSGKDTIDLSFVSKAKYDGKEWADIDKWVDLKKIESESSYMSAPFLREPILENTTVIHVVRHPIKVVNSFCNYIDYFQEGKGRNSYEQFIYQYVPELKEEMPQYDRACLYYILWNKMIEEQEKTSLFLKIEDGPEKVLELLGKSGKYFNDTKVNTLKKPCNKKFSINQIESEHIKKDFIEIGEKYGYNMLSDMMLI